MGEFLAANSTWGQNLLKLVARGNAVIAELLRLKDYIPPVYRLDSKVHIQKYGPIIIDFAYFKAVNAFEEKIEKDQVLQDRDEELRSNYSEILVRFYLAFESIHKYVTDMNTYIEELEDGVYIQQSIESVMLNEEGKQLMCEVAYLYGIMLLIVDCYFEGRIRERLLVSYYRYSGQRASSTKVDDVCMLLRSTGYVKSSLKRPANYPESYFQRIPVNNSFIDLVITRLRTDELYNQSVAFPYPEHRSVALGNQAAMLVILLCFQPNTLHSSSATMREIVDKFFPDNWIISVYLGIIIDLVDWWSPYKAARTALNNSIETANVKNVAKKFGEAMEKQIKETKQLQSNSTLDENTIGKVVKIVRNCNVTLHWILLHTALPTFPIEELKRCKSLRQMVIQESKYTMNQTLKLLLSTAQIEYEVKQMYKQLLQDKEKKWLDNKETCVRRINELAKVFAGHKQLDDVEKNTSLETWFKEIGKHIDALQAEDGKKIAQLYQALDEVQEFHQLEHNLHILQHLADTREILRSMLRTGNVSQDDTTMLDIITDCCYAWTLLESSIPAMQSSIKNNPRTVIDLKALFLKMASAIEMPLLRINQAHSADLSSVSQYYSRELESFARRVLQIIPETVFGILAQIVHLETNVFLEIPTKLPKDKIKDYAQLDERLKMAELTYSVSVFTEGLLSLRSVSLGVLRVDSHRLLEDGIRQELVKKITFALHNGLIFGGKTKTSLTEKLQKLGTVMDGYRKSFQYIQDYININSLKIWHEEITYVINKAVEEECRGSTWTPGISWMSYHDEKTNSNLNQSDSNSLTFMSSLTKEIIRISDPRTSIYIEHTLAWYDLKTQVEVLSHKVFNLILQVIETPGLCGINKLLSFYIAVEIEKVAKHIDQITKNKFLATVLKECEIIMQTPDYWKTNPGKLYSLVNTNANKLWFFMLEWILNIGHYQLLKHNIAYELNIACKFEAKHMEAALKTFNESVLATFYSDKDENWKSDSQKVEMFQELGIRLDWIGISDSWKKIYTKKPETKGVAFILFLFTILQLHKLHYCKNTASLLSKKVQDAVDAVEFVLGIQTVLRQFGEEELYLYVEYLCKYVLNFVTLDSSKLTNEWEMEGITGLHLIELFTRFADIEKSIILQYIPDLVYEQYINMTKV